MSTNKFMLKYIDLSSLCTKVFVEITEHVGRHNLFSLSDGTSISKWEPLLKLLELVAGTLLLPATFIMIF